MLLPSRDSPGSRLGEAERPGHGSACAAGRGRNEVPTAERQALAPKHYILIT